MQTATVPAVALFADDLCLAYVNTRYWRGSPKPTEELNDINNVLAWSEAALPATIPLARQCAAHWVAPAANGTLAFAAAIGLREVLYRVMRTTADQLTPDLASLNLALRQAAPRQTLAPAAAGFGWTIDPPETPSVAVLLSPVLWSAADLLAGPRRTRLRACANPNCGYLFIDDSKSANRRWCTMATCGNRAKAHRHYLKSRAPA